MVSASDPVRDDDMRQCLEGKSQIDALYDVRTDRRGNERSRW
jgi:hypothetical protein